MRNVLEGFGVDVPIDVVPNGIDIQPFLHPVLVKDRQELGIKPEDVLLVYSGRLGPEKNLPFLLRSFAGVAHAYEHVHLMMLGDGPERGNLEESMRNMQMNHRVHFTGMVPYSEIPGYLSIADAFITASVTEVHPLSVIEAMAAGLPALGINSPGVGDTIQDGLTGYLVHEEEMASFTAKLVRLVTETESRRKMSANARKAAEMYAIERTVKLMEEKYQKAIQGAAARRVGLRARFNRWLDRARL
jgi:glycosyltransferase involved in cell wall biosynthesis